MQRDASNQDTNPQDSPISRRMRVQLIRHPDAAPDAITVDLEAVLGEKEVEELRLSLREIYRLLAPYAVRLSDPDDYRVEDEGAAVRELPWWPVGVAMTHPPAQPMVDEVTRWQMIRELRELLIADPSLRPESRMVDLTAAVDELADAGYSAVCEVPHEQLAQVLARTGRWLIGPPAPAAEVERVEFAPARSRAGSRVWAAGEAGARFEVHSRTVAVFEQPGAEPLTLVLDEESRRALVEQLGGVPPTTPWGRATARLAAAGEAS